MANLKSEFTTAAPCRCESAEPIELLLPTCPLRVLLTAGTPTSGAGQPTNCPSTTGVGRTPVRVPRWFSAPTPLAKRSHLAKLTRKTCPSEGDAHNDILKATPELSAPAAEDPLGENPSGRSCIMIAQGQGLSTQLPSFPAPASETPSSIQDEFRPAKQRTSRTSNCNSTPAWRISLSDARKQKCSSAWLRRCTGSTAFGIPSFLAVHLNPCLDGELPTLCMTTKLDTFKALVLEDSCDLASHLCTDGADIPDGPGRP